ncbi:hypothetical protein [Vogesella oryzagri]
MASHKRGFQYARPLWIPALDASTNGRSLNRLAFARDMAGQDMQYDESWLQSLLYRFPHSLPVAELEPGIGVLIPVGREIPTPVGPIDNLFITQEGNIVLVECKLWRNPEARRKVISQIIDYAQSISQWRYEDLDAAIRKGIDDNGKPCGKSLLEVVGEVLGSIDEIDEAAFVDAVQKNLRMGRVLLLVVGDGNHLFGNHTEADLIVMSPHKLDRQCRLSEI